MRSKRAERLEKLRLKASSPNPDDVRLDACLQRVRTEADDFDGGMGDVWPPVPRADRNPNASGDSVRELMKGKR